MKILYAEGGVVYVNLNYLALVKKYSSNENADPTSFYSRQQRVVNRPKTKAKKKIKEAARELIYLYAKRKATKGYYIQRRYYLAERTRSFFLLRGHTGSGKSLQKMLRATWKLGKSNGQIGLR